MKQFVDELKNVTQCEILENEPMKKHTTFKVGGPADYFIAPGSVHEIKSAIECAKKYGISWRVIGGGSNLLVRDEGFRGLIICLGSEFSSIEINEDKDVYAQAGARLPRIGSLVAKEGLTGFEFASGIPGSVGGAVMMNAGAYGNEIKDIIVEAQVLKKDGEIQWLSKDELELGYRTSCIKKNGYVVLGAHFKLAKGDSDRIKEKMQDLSCKRKEKQPLEYPSAGSTFKRPEGYFAAKLIEDAGLKGFGVGGAMVSEKHAGFVINKDDATASDIIKLTDEIKKKVKEQFGVELELEVELL